MSDLHQLLERLIEKKFWLEKERNEGWLLSESGTKYKFIYPLEKSFAFRIDKKSIPFLSVPSPQYTTKMCDSFIVLKSGKTDYVFSVEVKSKNYSHFKKQIRNGYYFVEWLVSLLREHGHYKKEPIYLGLLIWKSRKTPKPPKVPKPRKIPSKGTTARQILEFHLEFHPEPVGKFKGHWKVPYQSDINMKEFVSSYNQSYKHL
jgi:hypothetical protein